MVYRICYIYPSTYTYYWLKNTLISSFRTALILSIFGHATLKNYVSAVIYSPIYREYFMESAGVRYLRTSCWRIRNRTSERSERVRFLIQKQRVRKYRTKHFPCGIVFIIYILRFKFLFIVFNDRPRQNSVTWIQVKNSCKDYNISLNFYQKFNITESK